jgi:predicted amidophosphoribosyltransferase
MDKCSKCKGNAQLYENGNPICAKCSAQIDAARRHQATRQRAAEKVRLRLLKRIGAHDRLAVATHTFQH